MSTERGRIKSWKQDKAYGFIAPDAGGDDVFLHINDFRGRGRTPQPGEIVCFRRETSQGRWRARQVMPEAQVRSMSALTQQRLAASLLVLGFFAFVFYIRRDAAIPDALPVYYLVLSAITFLFYAWDQWQARRDGWRTPEARLQGLAFLGGWPGALLAQYFLRHKSAKRSFQIVFIGVTLCHLLLLGVFLQALWSGEWAQFWQVLKA